MLRVRNLNAFYGQVQVLRDVGFDVAEGELVALVGANAAGKSTTVKAISGLIPRTTGTIEFEGRPIRGVPAHEVARRGLIHIPERRRLFPLMTVQENLELGAFTGAAKARRAQTMDEVYALLPALRDRRNQLAATLSGGEQQMGAIGRGLMARPKLLMMDEPTEGLAPLFVERIFEIVARIRATGTTVLIIEQNVSHVLGMADRGYALENGRIVLAGTGPELLADDRLRAAYLGL